MRTLGLYRSAERQAERLPKPVQEALQAYANGVNAYLDQHDGPWPPEFTLLAYDPAPWRPADSLVLGKLLALLLGGNWFEELRRAALLDRLTPEEVEFLMPTDLAGGPPTLAAAETLPVAAAQLLAAVPPLLQPRRASNAWAVDGRHTESGKPILASDPHLGLTAPGIWYLASISAPGLSMTGGTVPGHAGASAGTQRPHRLGSDDNVRRFDRPRGARGSAGRSERATAWGDDAMAFTVREEHIHVRLGRDEMLQVRETIVGPVLSDVLDSAAARRG